MYRHVINLNDIEEPLASPALTALNMTLDSLLSFTISKLTLQIHLLPIVITSFGLVNADSNFIGCKLSNLEEECQDIQDPRYPHSWQVARAPPPRQHYPAKPQLLSGPYLLQTQCVLQAAQIVLGRHNQIGLPGFLEE